MLPEKGHQLLLLGCQFLSHGANINKKSLTPNFFRSIPYFFRSFCKTDSDPHLFPLLSPAFDPGTPPSPPLSFFSTPASILSFAPIRPRLSPRSKYPSYFPLQSPIPRLHAALGLSLNAASPLFVSYAYTLSLLNPHFLYAFPQNKPESGKTREMRTK